MDPLSFFSPEELGAWADHRLMRDWLQLTGLALKLGFLVAVLASGLHQQLRTLAENLAARLYARPGLCRPPGLPDQLRLLGWRVHRGGIRGRGGLHRRCLLRQWHVCLRR